MNHQGAQSSPTIAAWKDRAEAAGGGRGAVISGFAALIVMVSVGCISNPTPHPAQDATQTPETGRADGDPNVAAPTDEAGCDDLGGFWTGDACDSSPNRADGVDGADGDASDGSADPDGSDGETLDGDDAETNPDAGPADSEDASSPG